MRARAFLATVMLAGTVVMACPGVAHASDGKNELRQCLQKAEQKSTDAQVNQAASNCEKAPNLLTPAIGELVWGGVAFLIVIAGLMKVGFPAVKKGLQQREDKIRGDLEGAEHSKTEAQNLLAQYETQLAKAQTEANRIIEEGRQAAEDMRKDIMAKAETDAAELRNRAGEDIRLATDRATAELQAKVGDLSIDLAERIVERNLDRDTQIQLIENYINEVGAK